MSCFRLVDFRLRTTWQNQTCIFFWFALSPLNMAKPFTLYQQSIVFVRSFYVGLRLFLQAVSISCRSLICNLFSLNLTFLADMTSSSYHSPSTRTRSLSGIPPPSYMLYLFPRQHFGAHVGIYPSSPLFSSSTPLYPCMDYSPVDSLILHMSPVGKFTLFSLFRALSLSSLASLFRSRSILFVSHLAFYLGL